VEELPYANMVAKGLTARTVEDVELSSVHIAAFSRFARTVEGVRYANMERFDLHVRNV
jgi:hypothetical protein